MPTGPAHSILANSIKRGDRFEPPPGPEFNASRVYNIGTAARNPAVKPTMP